MSAVELLGLRQWHLLPTSYYKEEGQRLICSRIRTEPETTAKSGGLVLTELCGFIPVNERSR